MITPQAAACPLELVAGRVELRVVVGASEVGLHAVPVVGALVPLVVVVKRGSTERCGGSKPRKVARLP